MSEAVNAVLYAGFINMHLELITCGHYPKMNEAAESSKKMVLNMKARSVIIRVYIPVRSWIFVSIQLPVKNT